MIMYKDWHIWEDPREKEMVTHSSILAWRIPWTEEAGYSPWGHKESTQLSVSAHTHRHTYMNCDKCTVLM